MQVSYSLPHVELSKKLITNGPIQPGKPIEIDTSVLQQLIKHYLPSSTTVRPYNGEETESTARRENEEEQDNSQRPSEYQHALVKKSPSEYQQEQNEQRLPQVVPQRVTTQNAYHYHKANQQQPENGAEKYEYTQHRPKNPSVTEEEDEESEDDESQTHHKHVQQQRNLYHQLLKQNHLQQYQLQQQQLQLQKLQQQNLQQQKFHQQRFQQLQLQQQQIHRQQLKKKQGEQFQPQQLEGNYQQVVQQSFQQQPVASAVSPAVHHEDEEDANEEDEQDSSFIRYIPQAGSSSEHNRFAVTPNLQSRTGNFPPYQQSQLHQTSQIPGSTSLQQYGSHQSHRRVARHQPEDKEDRRPSFYFTDSTYAIRPRASLNPLEAEVKDGEETTP